MNQLPVAFAQVREDALLDMEVARKYASHNGRMIMVASGGCTAAALVAASNLQELHLVDPNPHQLEISRLKLRLLHEPLQTRLELLGHAPMDKKARKKALSSLGVAVCDTTAEYGVDHAGRYEMLFRKLRMYLARHQGLERAFHEVMSLHTLVELFGKQATQNRLQDFSSHFVQRTKQYLRDGNVAAPYFQQIFGGTFVGQNYTPWLTMKAPERYPEMHFTNAFMQTALKDARELDVVHLSNILDWQSEQEAEATLELAARALKRNGVVTIRQLNSTLEIPKLSSAFTWLKEESEELHRKDRSFIYRHFYVGQKV